MVKHGSDAVSSGDDDPSRRIYRAAANSIEMIRRPFDFPDSKEGQVARG